MSTPREVNADGGMETGRDGWRNKMGGRRDGFRRGGLDREREGILEDGWIGGEHKKDREGTEG